jgi:hypothetical protein
MTTDLQGHPLGDHREEPPIPPVVPQMVSPLSPACGHHCGVTNFDGSAHTHVGHCPCGECHGRA